MLTVLVTNVDPKQYIRYAAIDTDILITVLDVPDPDYPFSTIVVRDKTGITLQLIFISLTVSGMYCWDTRLTFLPFSEDVAKDPDLSQTSVSKTPFDTNLRTEYALLCVRLFGLRRSAGLMIISFKTSIVSLSGKRIPLLITCIDKCLKSRLF